MKDCFEMLIGGVIFLGLNLLGLLLPIVVIGFGLKLLGFI